MTEKEQENQIPDKIVSMIEHKGIIFIATEKQVFQIIDNKLVPLRGETKNDRQNNNNV